MVGGPGRGLCGAAARTRYGSPSSAGIGMVGGRAVWAGRVVTFDMSGSGAVIGVGGRAAECALMLRAASSRVASWRSARHGRSRRGGDADGRAVVMGCDEPLARGGGAVAEDWRGLVWCTSGLPAGISGCSGLLLVGWRAATLSRSCHKWCETWWDAGRYAETISAGRREGRDELGRVNMASR